MAASPDHPTVDVTLDADSLAAIAPGTGNQPERLEWFRDQALGMFIHWGLDVMLGTVPSHWMIGADPALVDRFIQETPTWFDPSAFAPEQYARLARQVGMRYAVFTAKHHSGFCMFETATTPFNVMATPYARDVTGLFLAAFRNHGIAPGLYFSPLDFLWCHQQGKALHFRTPEVMPANNPALMDYNLAQVTELLTYYGALDTLFFDGPPEQLRELAWSLQPQVVITRGAMETPEQCLPDEPLAEAWEACWTIGDGWSYKPTLDTVKSGSQLIDMLIRTRAMGGNLLLNVTPGPDGGIPPEQERVLRELGTWLFFNGEAIYGVRPWRMPREQQIWYTRAKDSDTVYAFVTGTPWHLGTRRQLTLRGVAATDATTISIVGQCDILEHSPEADTAVRWQQDESGLNIDAMLCYRPWDNRRWPNAIVLRITGAR